MGVDPEKVVVDPQRSIDAGALSLFQPGSKSWRLRMIETLAKAMGFSLRTPWNRLSAKARAVILQGSGEQELEFEFKGKKSSYKWEGKYEGVVPMLERRYRESESQVVRGEIEKFMSVRLCPDCKGRRLRPEALAITVAGHAVDELTTMPVAELRRMVPTLTLSDRERAIAAKVLQEIGDRLGFLDDVGVGYLTLDRSSATLSGGESQRIRLATQIGSKLMGVLYVLDEPSIGLHQRDNDRLITTLKGMRDLGNTVLVVEHDEDTILAADWVLDLGPGAGIHGGELVACGTPEQVAEAPDSLTGRYLRGELAVAVPKKRRAGNGKKLVIEGARHNNLRNLDVAFPLGAFTVVTGVSGSGKSSLVNDILHRALARHFYEASELAGKHDRLTRCRAPRQGDRHRPEPDRPDAALESGDLHQRLRADPQSHGDDPGGARPRLQGRALQLQRRRRPLRGLRRRRPDQDRDALPARYLRHLRSLRRQALRPRDAGGALQGSEHRRDPRLDHRAGATRSSATSRRSSGSLRPSSRSVSATSTSASPRPRSRAARRSG